MIKQGFQHNFFALISKQGFLFFSSIAFYIKSILSKHFSSHNCDYLQSYMLTTPGTCVCVSVECKVSASQHYTARWRLPASTTHTAPTLSCNTDIHSGERYTNFVSSENTQFFSYFEILNLIFFLTNQFTVNLS